MTEKHEYAVQWGSGDECDGVQGEVPRDDRRGGGDEKADCDYETGAADCTEGTGSAYAEVAVP